MCRTAIFMADGCEEIEGLTVVDTLRRAGLTIDMVSITGSASVTGSHGITFQADLTFEQADLDGYDAVVLPGGMPGTLNLGAHDGVQSAICSFAESGKLVAAICAAPSVLGAAGILNGKRATCHPGFEEKLSGAEYLEETVVTDQNVITSRGMGTAIDFALAIVEYQKGSDAVADLKQKLVYR